MKNKGSFKKGYTPWNKGQKVSPNVISISKYNFYQLLTASCTVVALGQLIAPAAFPVVAGAIILIWMKINKRYLS